MLNSQFRVEAGYQYYIYNLPNTLHFYRITIEKPRLLSQLRKEMVFIFYTILEMLPGLVTPYPHS